MAGNRRSGRPRKPAEIHIAAGTYRADRHGPRDAKAVAVAGVPAKPTGLTKDESWLWNSIVEDLVRRDVAKAIDTALLWSMCELWGFYRAAYRAAKKDPVDRDARIAVTSYWAKFEIAASRFGLNASDRAKLASQAPAAKKGIQPRPRA